MEKVINEFKIVELDDGFRIEIKGDKEAIRQMLKECGPYGVWGSGFPFGKFFRFIFGPGFWGGFGGGCWGFEERSEKEKKNA